MKVLDIRYDIGVKGQGQKKKYNAPEVRIFHQPYKIEDSYFFEVNTKYISSSVLKTSEFSRVLGCALVKILMFST